MLLTTLLAAALRFGTLNVQSIWLDESATLVLVHRGFSGMLSHLSESESAPPLYYVVVWAWTKVFGAGPLGFRSLSALVGTLTVPVMYAAGRQISPRVGVWAAVLTAVNPAMYYYSQEARCYALLILFSACALVFWLRALEAPDRRNLTLWSAMSILALLTHYFAAFLFLPEAAILLYRLGWRKIIGAAGAVALVGVALLPLALSQHTGKVEWIGETSLLSRTAETVKQFAVGLYSPDEILSGLLVGLLAATALIFLWRRGSSREHSLARDLVLVAGGAVLLPLLLALTHLVDVFDGRNVIAGWAPWGILLAIALGMHRAGRSATLIGACLCILSLAVIAAVNLSPGYQRDDWRGAAHALPTGAVDRVIVGEPYSSPPLSIYLPATRPVTGQSVDVREVDFIALRIRRTGRSPLLPSVPTRAPSGFRLAGVRKTSTYAVSRFVSSRARILTAALLRRLSGEPGSALTVQR